MTQYCVQRLPEDMNVDADWNKPQWRAVEAINVCHSLGEIPAFTPRTQVKVLYNDSHIYAIFRVEDRYVRAVTRQTNGQVWKDSCVEFFFTPQNKNPTPYFNLEVNCGGKALLHCNRVPRDDITIVESSDVETIEIAHSMPDIVEPERTEPTVWVIEYRIPVRLLEKYTSIIRPWPGVIWRANFYKCGDKTSNPHWMTWSPITNGKVNFHQPGFFGTLKFE